MFDSVGTPLEWAVFGGIVVVLLFLDLFVFHRRAHRVGTKEAAIWTAVWIGVSLLFNAWIWLMDGSGPALEFLAGYLIEKSLSVDNLFVFLVIFHYFKLPEKDQHKVLFWGILGAVVTRGAFIALGVALISKFHFVIFLLGAFLVYTGFRVAFRKHEEVHPERNPVVRLFRKMVPLTDGYRGDRFFVKENGKRMATVMFLVLVVVEATDIVFAIDSVPAVLAVTKDPFLVFSSNILAILGLRALFFLLAELVEKFRYLKVGVGMILVFVGLKMVASEWIEIPIAISLGVIALLLGGSVALSLLRPAGEEDEPEGAPPDPPPD